jgi:hypothetical protein
MTPPDGLEPPADEAQVQSLRHLRQLSERLLRHRPLLHAVPRCRGPLQVLHRLVENAVRLVEVAGAPLPAKQGTGATEGDNWPLFLYFLTLKQRSPANRITSSPAQALKWRLVHPQSTLSL